MRFGVAVLQLNISLPPGAPDSAQLCVRCRQHEVRRDPKGIRLEDILRRLRRRVEFAALSKRRPWQKTGGNPGGRNCAGASDIPSKDLD
jgi:hypothetical protein